MKMLLLVMIKPEFTKLVSPHKNTRTGDHTLILGTVKDRIGSGHEYLIEWANQENKQTCSIQHLVSAQIY